MWHNNRAGGQGQSIASATYLSIFVVPDSQWGEGPTYEEKVIFLISKPVWTNLVIKHYVLANIVIIAFISVGGLRSPALPHQGQSGLEK